jgi:hypothetical protein
MHDIQECANFIILLRSTRAHYAVKGAYKNDIKHLTNLSTFSFTLQLGSA